MGIPDVVPGFSRVSDGFNSLISNPSTSSAALFLSPMVEGGGYLGAAIYDIMTIGELARHRRDTKSGKIPPSRQLKATEGLILARTASATGGGFAIAGWILGSGATASLGVSIKIGAELIFLASYMAHLKNGISLYHKAKSLPDSDIDKEAWMRHAKYEIFKAVSNIVNSLIYIASSFCLVIGGMAMPAMTLGTISLILITFCCILEDQSTKNKFAPPIYKEDKLYQKMQLKKGENNVNTTENNTSFDPFQTWKRRHFLPHTRHRLPQQPILPARA